MFYTGHHARQGKDDATHYKKPYLEFLKCLVFYWGAMIVPTGQMAEPEGKVLETSMIRWQSVC